MTKYETLDRMLAGELVEASEDLVALAMLADEVEAVFTDAEPTASAARRGLNASLEAFHEAAPAQVRPHRSRRLATRALVAAAMLVALPAVGWAASEDALPGDVLYPVKRAFEQVRLTFAGSPIDEAAVLLDQAAERLGEAARAHALGRDEAVSLAVGEYAGAMEQFEARIAEARRLGLDVSALVALAHQLAQEHQALLDVLLGSAPTPGGEAVDVVSPAPPASPGREPGRQTGPPAAQAGQVRGDEAADEGGQNENKKKKKKGKNRKGGADGSDQSEGDTGGGDAPGPPAGVPPGAPGKSGGAPHGKAEGHQKHGPPPHGKASGHAKHGPPPPFA